MGNSMGRWRVREGRDRRWKCRDLCEWFPHELEGGCQRHGCRGRAGGEAVMDWIESHLGLAVVLMIVVAIAANVVFALAMDALGIPWVWTSDHGIVALLWK